jgi:Fe-S cluster assembly protein SufD
MENGFSAMGESKAVSTIARERVEDLALRHAEPDWLKQARLSSWETYLQMPMPTARDQDWHRTDISSLELSSLIALDFAATSRTFSAAHDWIKPALNHFTQRAGVLSQAAHSPGYIELDAELEKKGVIFCDLGVALKEHEGKLRQYLGVPSDCQRDDKFALMVKSLFNCGLFLYVPAGVEIDAPFLSFTSAGTPAPGTTGSAIFPRLVVLAEANSKLTLIHSTAASAGPTPAATACLHAGLVEIYAQPGAKVNFLDLLQLDSEVYSVTRTTAAIQKNAAFRSLTVALGGKVVKGDIAALLNGPGATSDINGIVLGSGHEHYNFNTVEDHNSPDTSSNINFRTALKDSATSVYQGIIRVPKVAQRTNAYQSNKNLLLGGEAKADSIPKLEILADDVKCSHGATVGPVDQEQIFYLMSRGLTRTESEELIVQGFFKTVLDQFGQTVAAEWVGNAVTQRILSAPAAAKSSARS